MTDPMQAERWVRLADSDWVNIVNHPEVLGHGNDADLAVACAVRLTEARLRELNASELRSLRDALALAKSRIAELEKTLAPFAQFGKSDIWAGTMWEDKSEDWQVMYSHATGKFITLGDFLRARAALKEEGQ